MKYSIRLLLKKESPSYKRRMEDICEEGFKSFKIYLDNSNIKKQLEGN